VHAKTSLCISNETPAVLLGRITVLAKAVTDLVNPMLCVRWWLTENVTLAWHRQSDPLVDCKGATAGLIPAQSKINFIILAYALGDLHSKVAGAVTHIHALRIRIVRGKNVRISCCLNQRDFLPDQIPTCYPEAEKSICKLVVN